MVELAAMVPPLIDTLPAPSVITGAFTSPPVCAKVPAERIASVLPDDSVLPAPTLMLPDVTVERLTVPVPPLPIGPPSVRSPVTARLRVAPGVAPAAPAIRPVVPCTVSAVASTMDTLPLATRLFSVAMLLACVRVMLPRLPVIVLTTLPVSVFTVRAPFCVTAPVVCRSSVVAVWLAMVRSVAVAMTMPAPVAVPAMAPRRRVAAFSV